MTESEIPMRPRSCPRCGARARVVTNPYFGVGLAVHTHLLSCTGCQFIGFLAGQNTDRTSVASEQTPPPSRHWLRFGRR